MEQNTILEAHSVTVETISEDSPLIHKVAPPLLDASRQTFDARRQPAARASDALSPSRFGSGCLKSWQAYALATAAAFGTLCLRLALARQLEGRPTLIVFTLPIMLSAYLGGLRAGFLATAICYLGASYYLLPPFNSFWIASAVDRWDVFLLALAGVVISALNEALHRARRRADVAIRKRAQEDRQRFFELSQDVHCILGFDGYFKDLNPAWERTLGYTKAELLTTPFIEFIHPDDREATLAEAEKVCGGKTLVAFENRYRCKDGSYRWFQWGATPVIEDRVMYGIARDITERKQAESVTTRLAAIVESSDDAIISKDLNSIITSWNKGAEKIFGYSAGEMVGTSILRLIPADRHDEEDQFLGKIKRDESVDHFETRRRTRDGRLIDVSITASPIKATTGRIIGVSKVARDITGRKHAEEALRASEARLRIVTDNARVGLVMVNRERCYTFANATYAEILGLTLSNLVGQRVADVLAPLYEEQIRPHLDRAFAGERVAYELHRPTPGANHYYTVKYEPTKVNGSVSLVVVVITDITEQKQAEAAWRASEARYRTLFEYAPDGIVIADMEGRYLDANPAICRMLGYSREEMVARSVVDVVVPEEISHVAPAFAEVDAGIDHHREWQFRREDGSVFAAEVTATQVPNDLVMGMVRDITERKQAEEKIHQLNTELEQRVADRTAELEVTNKELEAFSYSVSHDLRAPLRAVNGFAEIVLQDFGSQLPEEGKCHLERICKGGQQMGELIDDLLAFSRLSRQSVNRLTVDTNELVQHVLDELKPQQNGRPIELKIGKMPSCQGDPALLKQVWVNLLSNAIKYTRDRKPAIVEAGCVCENGENIYFVRDNGVGFDMRYVNKLFGVFQRLHRADEFEGTGVGLAIVQRIVHRHGGRVWAEAKVNQGSAFYFTIEGKSKV
jgi:PAS domain S-box-containing protein